MINTITLIGKLIRYNLKIIFAGRFIWFLLAALVFYIFFMVMRVLDNAEITGTRIYELAFFPAILLIFYPMVFGIQRDDDAGMLEILFGIPDYRYKVWLVRMLLIFIQVFILIVLLAWLGSWLLYPINPFAVGAQLLFPVGFLGSLAFLVSTWVKNGNATAAIMVLVVLTLLIFSDPLEETLWHIFLNPFRVPRGFSESAWQDVVWKNRLFLSVGIIVSLLWALLNLQKRERYV